MTVKAVLYQVLKRLSRAHATGPDSGRGGGSTGCTGGGWYEVAIPYPPVNRMWRLYRLPSRDQLRLMAR